MQTDFLMCEMHNLLLIVPIIDAEKETSFVLLVIQMNCLEKQHQFCILPVKLTTFISAIWGLLSHAILPS